MATEIQKADKGDDSAVKTLILMRHAKSDWHDTTLSDHDRPLNRRGIRDAPVMGRWLAEVGDVPGLVLCSSAVRTRQTAAAMWEVWNVEPVQNTVEDLYLSPPSTIVDTIAHFAGDHDAGDHDAGDHDAVMVIAHNPGISQLVSLLSGESIEMATAAIAVFELRIHRWRDLAMDTGATRTRFMWPKAI